MLNFLLNGFNIMWVMTVLDKLFIYIDIIVYSFLEAIIKSFYAIASVNFSFITENFAPLVSTVKTLVGIFIMFRISLVLLQYLMEPDKVKDQTGGSTALIQNIVIVVVMLILLESNILFGIFHDIQKLIIPQNITMSNSTSSGGFEVLDTIGLQPDNENMLMKLIFGKEVDNQTDTAHELTWRILNTFLFTYEGSELVGVVTGDDIKWQSWEEYKDKNCPLGKLTVWDIECSFKTIVESKSAISFSSLALPININTNVKYYPIVSTAVGIYIIIMFCQVAIQLVLRALKLIALEIVSPIAIISYANPKNKKLWSDFWSLYFSVFLELFFRVLTIYMGIYAMNMIMSAFADITAVSDLGIFENLIIKILLILAIARFIKEFPKILEQLFKVRLDPTNKKSFLQLMGGVLGAGFGAGTGIAAGIRAGAGGLGTAWSAVTGLFGGAKSGSDAQNVGSFVSGQIASIEKTSARAYNVGNAGGMGGYVGANASRIFGETKRLDQELKFNKEAGSTITEIENRRNELFSKTTDSRGIAYGTEDSYISNNANVVGAEEDLKNYSKSESHVMQDLNSTTLTDFEKTERIKAVDAQIQTDIANGATYSTDDIERMREDAVDLSQHAITSNETAARQKAVDDYRTGINNRQIEVNKQRTLAQNEYRSQRDNWFETGLKNNTLDEGLRTAVNKYDEYVDRNKNYGGQRIVQIGPNSQTSINSNFSTGGIKQHYQTAQNNIEQNRNYSQNH